MKNTFQGSDYSQEHDRDRLMSQLLVVKKIMADGEWHTIRELTRRTGFMDASISRYLRYLRAPKFGGHTIAKRVCGDRKLGLYEYHLTTPQEDIPNETQPDTSAQLTL